MIFGPFSKISSGFRAELLILTIQLNQLSIFVYIKLYSRVYDSIYYLNITHLKNLKKVF